MAVRRRSELDPRAARDRVRVARRGGGSLTYVLLVLAGILMALALSSQMRYRKDLSESKFFSLSPQTEAVLGDLTEDVHLYALFSEDHPRREAFWNLLQLYRQASPRIQVEFIDPVAQPGAVQRLDIPEEQAQARLDGATVVVRGERQLVFRGFEEEDVTNAILEVGSARRRVAGILRGYGERDPDYGGEGGFSMAAGALKAEYYELREIRLDAGIPEEVTVVLAPGLRKPIPESEARTMSEWLEAGGRLLVMTEPEFAPLWNPLLERWGLRLTGEVVADPRSHYRGDPSALRIVSFSSHPVVRDFGANFPLRVVGAGTVVHFEPGDPRVFHDDLAMTSEFAIAQAPDGARRSGRFSVAAASWRQSGDGDGRFERETRVVLVGDSDFASNRYFRADANENFFLNCVGWLSREAHLISIRKAALDAPTLNLEPSDRWWILLCAYGSALAVVLAGLGVYARRRRL